MSTRHVSVPLECVEDGLLDLTGDLSTFAPELASKLVLSADGESLEKQRHPITLQMLLTHTSGSAYDFMNPLVARWQAAHSGPPPEPGTRRPVEEFFDYPHVFQPGAGWEYGPGLDWAGRIVERATHRTLGEHMHARIFAPLGIADAAFYHAPRSPPAPREPHSQGPRCAGARGHGRHGHNVLQFIHGGGFWRRRDVHFGCGLSQGSARATTKRRDPAETQHCRRHVRGPPRCGGGRSARSHAAALAGPIGAAFRVGIELGARMGHGLGGMLTLEDTPGWYGAGTLTWGGGQTVVWFIDRSNGLCGVGSVQSNIPINIEIVSALKDTIRHDIYRKHAACQRGRKSRARLDLISTITCAR
ncbi:Acyltransferase LovD [Mycena sanguinolenta]|uniref:Acyltransferase LovD n=1 Tax=Mycena sanguinolenta TaxID=230812 RepID=A0A8H6XM03_9AGAR|nr:Acyltransferase LovD [Mycena sanguinolenta]